MSTKLHPAISKWLSKRGRLGGLAAAKSLGAKGRSKRARKAALARHHKS